MNTRPNPKYFGRRRGATWLNLVNDQAVGLAGIVLAGTPRDSFHVIDLLDRQDAGQRPNVIVTDTGSYSDMVFALLLLLGSTTVRSSPTFRRQALAHRPPRRLGDRPECGRSRGYRGSWGVAVEGVVEVAVEDARSNLEWEVGTSWCPAHLLALDHPFGDEAESPYAGRSESGSCSCPRCSGPWSRTLTMEVQRVRTAQLAGRSCGSCVR